ncbi:tigger transposable element-derived protein 6 [Biomphalaria pfeifferi]|uniref:Tigger transposable element-derived protein 6 n=1 Tax=Biomphalaria pfeifferi TaxID=112525 RepID=A0AAD8EXT6_BIOPF|nr:tigger transposable element-derived protein 6 [Biomphalaria pfeifferi]
MSTVKKNPGHRCRKRKIHAPQLIIDAIQEVKSGRLSIRKAAKQFQIPASTLFNKLTCKSLLEASRMLLTMKEEAQLAKWLVDLSQLGVVKTSEEVRLAARDIMAQRSVSSKSRNQLPSYTWLAGFYGRHPELALGIERAMITPQELNQWFSDFKAAVDGNDVRKIDPSSVYHATDSDSPAPKDASSLTISPKALTSPAALPSNNPLEGLTSVITSTSLDSNETSSPISLLIEASLVNVAPKSYALPETSPGNITSETPALPEASSLNTLSMGPGTPWSIPAETTNLREPSSSLSSPSQAHTSNKTFTTSMPFQTPTTSNASTPKEMSSQQLKALKDLCFFVADEISRKQLVMFLSKLSDSQAEHFPYPKDESQFHKFEELSHALLDLCHQDPPTKAKITEDDIFKIGLPSFKVKINTSSTPTLPSLVNGEVCIEKCIEAPVLRRKLKDKDDIKKEKMCKKLQKKEKRKKKEEEKEQKRLLRETKKLERQKKKEEQPKKKLKLRQESEDIDSDEDPVLAVRMEAEMTACDDYRTDSEDDLPNDLCKGCNKRDGTPMIQCQICDTRWHTSCAKTVRGLSTEQLKEVL